MSRTKKIEGEKLYLFHEVKNVCFSFLQEISYKLGLNFKDGYIDKSELKEVFIKYFPAETKQEKEYCDQLFESLFRSENNYKEHDASIANFKFFNKHKNENKYTTTIKIGEDNRPTKVPILFTIYEKRYLKTLLYSDAFRAIASEKLIIALEDVLSDVKPFQWDRLIIHRGRWNNAENLEVDIAKKIAKLMAIIEEGKSLICKYQKSLKAGEVQEVYPYKIMISAFTGKVHLLVKRPEEERITLMSVSDLYDIKVGTTHGLEDEDFYNLLELSKSSEPLVLEIKDKGNAINGIDRTFMMFSNYKKEANYDSVTGIHQIKMGYYVFDVEEIIQKILQLGQVVTVKSPQHIRNKVSKIIMKTWALYE